MSHFFGFVKVQKLKLSAHEPKKGEGRRDEIGVLQAQSARKHQFFRYTTRNPIRTKFVLKYSLTAQPSRLLKKAPFSVNAINIPYQPCKVALQ
jgi:hypothetical protein